MTEHAGYRFSYVLGTAGHVDHGKTSLIRALTGIDTDRLPEEKARGVSIDLGFAHLSLPSGRVLGVVDVPGHERFLKNMLAGVGGFDLVLLVIDAVESVMQQTREHMDILSQLGVSAGLVALTKADLVDPEMLELARDEIASYLQGTWLAGAPIVEVSAHTGQGLDKLRTVLDGLLDGVPPRPIHKPLFLPIDRVFTKTGFGTVITGTLWSGRLLRGERIMVYPGARESKVRGIQVHGEAVEAAHAGQRVAVNLGGVEVEDLHRGQVLAPVDGLQESRRVDALLSLLPTLPRPLKHRSRMRLYCGTTEALGHVILLEGDELAAGKQALVQLVLEQPLAARGGDRFVMRNATAEHTLGGGTFVDVNAPVHRRKDAATLEILRHREDGQTEALIRACLKQNVQSPWLLVELAAALKVERAVAQAWVEELEDRGEVVIFGEGRQVLLATSFLRMEEKVREMVTALQAKAPWRVGWKIEEIARLVADKPTRATHDIILGLVERGVLKMERNLLSTYDHRPHLGEVMEAARDRMLAGIAEQPYATPLWEDLKDCYGLDANTWKVLSEHLQETGQVTFIAKDIWFLTSSLEAVKQLVIDFIRAHGDMTPAQARDLLGTTRKYMIPLLEYLDNNHITRRHGEGRVLGSKALLNARPR
jgi:selenocysteine-specific elongation factor